MFFKRNKSNITYAKKEGDKALGVLINAPKFYLGAIIIQMKKMEL